MQQCTKEDVESLLYAIKEINSVAGCTIFTAACWCAVEQLAVVHEVAEKIFTNAEILFWCDDTMKGNYYSMINYYFYNCMLCHG